MSDALGIAHDPGGKIRLKLIKGMQGDANFSPCGRYRLWLARWWPKSDPALALWIGMNPSTADGDVDDPTIRRELLFTQRLGLGPYVKFNVMDYRATSPKALRAPGVEPCSPNNLPAILAKTHTAAKIIMAYGALPKQLQHHADAVVTALREQGHTLWCLGFTREGHPRHPLYVRGDAPLVEFAPEKAG